MTDLILYVCFYFVEKASTQESSKSFFCVFLVHLHALSTADNLLQFIYLSVYTCTLIGFALWLLFSRVPRRDGQTELTWIHTKPKL